MLTVNLDTAAFSRDLNRIADRIPQAKKQMLRRVGQHVFQLVVRYAGRTYKTPPTKGKNGKPLWTWTYSLARGQVMEESDDKVVIRTTGPAEKYEPYLATLQRSKDGKNRRNDIKGDAVRTAEPQIQPLAEQEFKNALGI